MGGKRSDHVPGNPLADYLQCYRFGHVTAAGAGTIATDIVTGMQRPLTFQSNNKKVEVAAWEIHAVTIKPAALDSAGAGNDSPYAATGCYAHFQLAYDEQAAMLDEYDGDLDDYIASGTFHLDLSTQGANSHFWPMALDVVNPRPVFAEHMTFLSLTPNVVPVNSAEFFVTIWYAPIVLEANQVELLLAMRARL